jgi:hypothetical protein
MGDLKRCLAHRGDSRVNGVHFALSFTRGLDNPRPAFLPGADPGSLGIGLAGWGRSGVPRFVGTPYP